MLLNLYLGTTAMAWATSIIFTIGFGQRMEREGYKIKKENKSFLERVIGLISTAFKLSIPGFNILITIGLLWMGDKIYESVVSDLLKEGKVYKITFSTTGREFKIHTTDYTEVGKEVGLNFFPEDIHVMSRKAF